QLRPETTKVLGARLGHLEGHRVRPAGLELDIPRVEVPVEDFPHPVVGVGDETVERHGHDGYELGHGGLLTGMWGPGANDSPVPAEEYYLAPVELSPPAEGEAPTLNGRPRTCRKVRSLSGSRLGSQR